ncbi:MAG: hypothetical protein QM765_31885 [Myxococcales bacterium]
MGFWMQLVVKRKAPGKASNSLTWSCQAPPQLPTRCLCFLSFRVAVGGEHLAVGVDVDALALGLLEQELEVLEVVAGDEDGLALDRGDAHRGGDRVAVGAGVGVVEERHDLEVELAHAQGGGQQLLGLEALLGGQVEQLVEEPVDLARLAAEDGGVLGVGGGALEPVEDELGQAGRVLADAGDLGLDGGGASLGEQALAVLGGDEGGGPVELLGRGLLLVARRGVERAGLLQRLAQVAEDGDEVVGVEVDVGDRGEQRLDHRAAERVVVLAEHVGAVGVHRDALGGVDHQVLQGAGDRVLAAVADALAALAADGLFTLVAEALHRTPSFHSCCGG